MSSPISPHRYKILCDELAGIDPAVLKGHLTRLDSDYFDFFSTEQIRSHLESIQTLSSERLCDVRLEPAEDGSFILTVTGFDFAGLFSILSGLITLSKFNIRAGTIFTYARLDSETTGVEDVDFFIKRKKIIDTIELTYEDSDEIDKDFVEKFQTELNGFLDLVRRNNWETARSKMNSRIGEHLAYLPSQSRDRLLPIDMDVSVDETATVLYICGDDTPAFLFSLSNALSLQGISIIKIFIRTDGTHVDDTIYIADKYDRPITDPDYLDRLKTAVVLIKQFTLLLPFASDPDIAMHQFDQFIDRAVFKSKDKINLLELQSRSTMASLAKVLGTGKYLWEEFVRMQYGSLLPMLSDLEELKKRKDSKVIADEISRLIADEPEFEDKVRIINEYKDKELFRIDMLYLIYPNRTFIEFSEDLTFLAEEVIRAVTALIYDGLCEKYAQPKTRDGQLCRWSVLALGKLGSVELGYASDIELQVVYEDSGFAGTGDNMTSNAEFFNTMVERMQTAIAAKQDGIFELDLRLRPDGNKGALSCSSHRWQQYYSKDGRAYDYERQALIRMRPVAGDKNFGNQMLVARDEILYSDNPVDCKNSMELRSKQEQSLVAPGTVNAKFSSGGLVELEYAVQFLQLKYGMEHPSLRQTNMVRVLESLLELKLISPTEYEKLFNSYAFLRRLINALRMVTGNAKDLVVPDSGSDEFLILIKRLGYVGHGDKSAQQLLSEDIRRTLDDVHFFYEQKFVLGRDETFERSGLPELLHYDLDDEKVASILSRLNVYNPAMVCSTLKNIAASVGEVYFLAAVLVLAQRHIRRSPSPDRVIINFEKFLLTSADPQSALRRMLFNPRLIELIVIVFGHSDFLSDFLITDPELLEYMGAEATLFDGKSHEHFVREIEEVCKREGDIDVQMESIRRYRNRELLRIGLRDIYLGTGLVQVVREISDLTDVIVGHTAHLVFAQAGRLELLEKQAVIALGKLGGRELNYSSDIDIVFVVSDAARKEHEISEFENLNNKLIGRLTQDSPFGKLFRVDTRLRPYGSAGPLCGTVSSYKNYYSGTSAHVWELQSWLKARVMAGGMHFGARLVSEIQTMIFDDCRRMKIAAGIPALRERIHEKLFKSGTLDTNVKLGPGGIRTIEFIVQSIQVQSGHIFSDIVTGNSLQALARIEAHKLITSERCRDLEWAYRFLRKLEHRVQLLGLRQEHLIPEGETEQTKLAKRMGFEDRLEAKALEQFLGEYEDVKKTVCQLWDDIMTPLIRLSQKVT